MIDKSLIDAYRQSMLRMGVAKRIMQNSCDDVKNTKFPLMQALLNEYYPDMHVQVVDVSENASSVDCTIIVQSALFNSCKDEDAFYKECYEKLMQALKYIEEMREEI